MSRLRQIAKALNRSWQELSKISQGSIATLRTMALPAGCLCALSLGTVARADEATVKIDVKEKVEVPVYYAAQVEQSTQLNEGLIEHTALIDVKVVQGEAESFAFEIFGEGDITEVNSLSEKENALASWSIRSEGQKRFLVLSLDEAATSYRFEVSGKEAVEALPASTSLLNFGPGEAVGFSSACKLSIAEGLAAEFIRLDGLTPVRQEQEERGGLDLDSAGVTTRRFLSARGGTLAIKLRKRGVLSSGIALLDSSLTGRFSEEEEWADFVLRGRIEAYADGMELPLLTGDIALAEIPVVEGLRFIARDGGYHVQVARAGRYDLALPFVAAVKSDTTQSSLAFAIPSATVLPVTLEGLGEVAFVDSGAISPLRKEEAWVGYVPASGAVAMSWSEGGGEGDGELFFSSEGLADIRVGAGLLRQETRVTAKVLQGELGELTLEVAGPGDVLAVEGAGVLSWERTEGGLEVLLREAVTTDLQLSIKSQLVLGEFPITVRPLRISPVGAVRHAGYLRVSNNGAVRLDIDLAEGLMQLPPDQFPAGGLKRRQLFAYRFPAADYQFAVTASRIVPEVTISEVAIYELSDSDRAIRSDIELDIREAALREWEIVVPADYSVVAVSGARVGDYVVGSEVVEGKRTLRVIFSEEVSGRQLINVHLEKNEPATAGEWVLPRVRYPAAKAVRGDIGVVSAAGFRLKVGEAVELAEKPLSFFPKKEDGLELAFRMRKRAWEATLQLEELPRSVEADVFHLYSLKDGTAYGSVVVNYFITGSPVDEWRLSVPSDAGNVALDGQNVRSWRRDGDEVVVTLQQPVIGLYTLLLTCEEPVGSEGGVLRPGRVKPLGVRGERGYVQVVSPAQVKTEIASASDGLLKLDVLELPAEFRLSSSAPSLAVYQYTERPFDLAMNVEWYEPGETIAQVVAFAEAHSRVSRDGEVVTDATYSVQTRDGRILRLVLPEAVRLWEVRVNDVAVTARRDGDATLVPLPAGADANETVEVKVRYGRPARDPKFPQLALPAVDAPVLKTEWSIEGDERRRLSLQGEGDFPKSSTGFDWLAEKAVAPLVFTALLIVGALCCGHRLRLIALILLAGAGLGALGIAGGAYFAQPEGSSEVSVLVPVLTAGEVVQANVGNFDKRQLHFDKVGTVIAGAGLLWFAFLLYRPGPILLYFVSLLLVSAGLLWMEGGAFYFAIFLGLCVLLLAIRIVRKSPDNSNEPKNPEEPKGSAPVASALLMGALLLASGPEASAGIKNADRVDQSWQIKDGRVVAEGTLTLTGEVGESFFFLGAPAVLTSLEGEGIHLEKSAERNGYVLTLLESPDPVAETEAKKESAVVSDLEALLEEARVAQRKAVRVGEDSAAPESSLDPKPVPEADLVTRTASFRYTLAIGGDFGEVVLPTGLTTVNRLQVTSEREGLAIGSEGAARVQSLGADEGSSASLLFLPAEKPGSIVVTLSPRERDPLSEETLFFAEVENAYVPGPGLLEGIHRISIRPSQGVVRKVTMTVPEGLTVSEVASGLVSDWRFNGESGQLVVELKEAQSGAFRFTVSTQQSLGALPLDLTIAPLRVLASEREVGLLGVAFRGQAQAEAVTVEGLLEVNLADFDQRMLPGEGSVLHRAYRYGESEASASLRIVAVSPEVRVTTTELLTVGSERTILKVDLRLEITRAGIFRFQFPVPEGYGIESLSGSAMTHFTEAGEAAERIATVHLRGQTEGQHPFALVLVKTGTVEESEQWVVPKVTLMEADRQTGQLVVNSEEGFRLRTLDRKNVSEVDPRTLGREGRNAALAFRLLQKDWELTLGIEELEPWVTGQVLHELILREGQTRHVVNAAVSIENASVQAVRVALAGLGEEESKTLRASGKAVSGIVPVDGAEDLWEITFKRRVIGDQQIRLEWERTGERAQSSELVQALAFPELRQVTYYVALRAGAQLEVTFPEMPSGWYRLDWAAVAAPLRDASTGGIPAVVLRANEEPLEVFVTRHAIAEALKLRVTEGKLTTVISPLGDILTAVNLKLNVIQRSTLRVSFGTAAGGDGGLFNVFVNGESVSVVRDGGDYLFYVLPGSGKQAAEVEFAYALDLDSTPQLALTTPKLSVPLENIEWRVVVPQGFDIDDVVGDLELEEQEGRKFFGKESYAKSILSRKVVEKEKGQSDFEQADALLQMGRRAEAVQLYQKVANNWNLDDATNEDARVKLQRVQTDQVVAGLNSRRQRLYLDNRVEDTGVYRNDELELAAASNVILSGETNFRPDELGNFLRGNSKEENQFLLRIADRLVKHQKATELAAQAISVPVPEEGKVYVFRRSVRVDEGAPLKLEMNLQRPGVTEPGNFLIALLLASVTAAAFAFGFRKWQS